MAEIPTLTVPDVQPRPTPAGDQRVNTPPQAFGALSAGESLKGTGQALTQGADATLQYAKAFQDLNNKAAADIYLQINQLISNFAGTISFRADNNLTATMDSMILTADQNL